MKPLLYPLESGEGLFNSLKYINGYHPCLSSLCHMSWIFQSLQRSAYYSDLFTFLIYLSQHCPTGNNIYHLRLGIWFMLLFATYSTFAAIILICKHATILCFSGYSAKLALTQAELNYQKANIASTIREHFTASYQEYTIEQFISFLMNTNIAV
ncbi:hypothetical protein EI94DRAFT_159128 [Lactarius quietus]|nr:hypothetical protein EI94DRAFT_159128 [Lactarius quietus]